MCHYQILTSDPDPAVYPHLVLYPPGDIKIAHKQTVLSNGPKSAGYPDFDIYPALKSTGYPDFCLYPPISNVYRQKTASIVGLKTRSVGYGYPDFCIYPPVSGKNESRKLRNASTLRSSGYPNFVIYPPIMSAGYPDFCIYPPVSRRSSKPRKLRMKKTLRSSGYPDFVIYPPIMFAGYPDFCIYPPVSRRSSKPRELRMERTLRSSGYPDFIIYSPITFAGYPDFCIYPPVSVKKSVQKLGTPKMSRTGGYPDFVLYAPVYPHFCLYPSIAGGNYKQSKGVMKTQCIYGFFDLYPATYPNLVLYPPKSGELCNSQTGAKGTSKPVVVLQPVTSYPIFDLYPAVEYPFSLDRIYGGAGLSFPATKAMSQQRVATSQWPVFQIYPVVQYPFSLDHIYEAVRLPSSKLQHATKPSDPWNHVWPYQKTSALKVAVRRTPRFTHAQLHAMVFASQPPMIRHHKSHRALHDEVFNDREVDTPSGNVSLFKLPSIQVDVVPRPRPRSSSIARRPPSTAPPMRGLPPRPDSFRNSPSPSPSPPYERTRLSPTTSPVSTAPAVPVAERRKSALPPRPDSFLLMKDAEPTEPLSIPRVVSTAPGEQRTSLLHRSATSVTPSRSGELRTAALQRSASSASRLTSVGPTAELRTTTLQRSMSSASRSTTPTRRGPTNLSPVDERPPELSRSTYLNDSRSSSNVADRFSGPDTPPRPLPRKRDSLVLQRARAFENNDDEPILSKFPLPPRPSGPGLPSRISSLQSNNRIGR
ncbi:hypothetical protein VKT23_002033 [Stygiomarasmius scandens]|uniref:Uncharacterized protein n=1 Tax=Marasmiellus scandens TaxID=2682957 RepID=A0ABR1K175_9AGAR